MKVSIDRFKVGQHVRVLVPCKGDRGDGVEVEAPAGTIGKIVSIDHYGDPQGWAITVVIDLGDEWDISNTFDEGDNPLYPFEIVDEAGEREYDISVTGVASEIVKVMARSLEEAEVLALKAAEEIVVAGCDISWEANGEC